MLDNTKPLHKKYKNAALSIPIQEIHQSHFEIGRMDRRFCPTR